MQIAGQTAELPEIRRRARFFSIIVVLAFIGLLVRLFVLQVVEGDSYYRLTSEAIIRTQILPALRGEIRDRTGRVLASTRPSYDLTVVPARLTREGYQQLARLIGSDHGEVPDWTEFQQRSKGRRERPYTLAEDISRDVMAEIETAMDRPGVEITAIPRREYPLGKLASNAIGYLNEVSGEELRTLKEEGYATGDLIGRTGIEKQWEPYLRGRKGMRKYLVDRRGVRRSEIRISDLIDGPLSVDPVPGENLVLTIDVEAQKLAERALQPHRAGAVVLLDVTTGRILALASTPGYDSNQMSGRLDPEVASRLFSDPLRPFRDRTLNETYGPGSTFKIVSALAALEDGLISPDERTKCNRFVQIGRRRFKCTKTHGAVNLYQAIVQSCNVYFYGLGMRPGMMNRLHRYAIDLGLGAPTGLGLNAEQPGFVPTEDWHRQRGESDPVSEGSPGFMIGHALNTVIGEGATRVTALQMALLYAAIARDGELYLPQIIDRIESNNGKILEQFPPRVRRHLSWSADNLAFLKRALIGVVNDPKGTAFKARSKTVLIAGKTGTSQVWAPRHLKDNPTLPPYAGIDHAWFAGFAPAAAPKVAFAVIIEHGGHGGDVAAPVATAIVERYLEMTATPAPTAGATHLAPR